MRKLVVLVAVVALLTAGCGGGGSGESSKPASAPVSLAGQTTNHGTKTASGTLEVELDDFYFGPTFIKATPGQRVTLELKNEGKATHTFTTTDLGDVDEQMAPGQSRMVTVTAPQSGNGVFFCRFHRGQGMQGAVFVG